MICKRFIQITLVIWIKSGEGFGPFLERLVVVDPWLIYFSMIAAYLLWNYFRGSYLTLFYFDTGRHSHKCVIDNITVFDNVSIIVFTTQNQLNFKCDFQFNFLGSSQFFKRFCGSLSC